MCQHVQFRTHAILNKAKQSQSTLKLRENEKGNCHEALSPTSALERDTFYLSSHHFSNAPLLTMTLHLQLLPSL